MVCPYRKHTIYSRSYHSNELLETQELFCDCVKEDCPYYGVDTSTYDYICKKVKLELGEECNGE